MELLDGWTAFFDALPEQMTWKADPGLTAQAPLSAAEEELIAAAVPKRQREFRAGRNLAHDVLARLDRPVPELLVAKGRSPDWPPGVVGSISHCDTLAVVAASTTASAIGIDVEPDAPLSLAVRAHVLTNADRIFWPPNQPNWDRVLFCAKEAFYKAMSARLAFIPEFRDVAIHPATPRTFRIMPLHNSLEDAIAGRMLSGHWCRRDGYCLAVVIERRNP